MEQSYGGLMGSIENYVLGDRGEIKNALDNQLYLLSFMGTVSAIDMVMSISFGKRDKTGFEYFCKNFLKKYNIAYASQANINRLWKMRTGLVHTWFTNVNFIVDNESSSHMTIRDGNFHVNVPLFFSNVKIAISQDLWDFFDDNPDEEKQTESRALKLFNSKS